MLSPIMTTVSPSLKKKSAARAGTAQAPKRERRARRRKHMRSLRDRADVGDGVGRPRRRAAPPDSLADGPVDNLSGRGAEAKRPSSFRWGDDWLRGSTTLFWP